MNTRIGIWVDDPLSDVLKPAFWDKIVDHKIKTVALMLEPIGGRFDPRYQIDQLYRFRTYAMKADVEVVLTVWPEPDIEYMASFEANIEDYLIAAGASALEFDAEGNWLPKKVRGFKNLDKAGDRLVELVKKLSTTIDCRSELTTYPYHVENSRENDVASHMHRVLPQAYSVRNRTNGQIPWNSKYGPGGMQRLTLDRASALVKASGRDVKLACGLAAYDQSWPGHRPEKAMEIAFAAALEYRPVEIRFWSSKWVFGIRKNGYASRFLKSL